MLDIKERSFGYMYVFMGHAQIFTPKIEILDLSKTIAIHDSDVQLSHLCSRPAP